MNQFRLFDKAYRLGIKHHAGKCKLQNCPLYANYPEGMAKRLQDAWKNGWINAETRKRGKELWDDMEKAMLMSERGIPDES